MKATEVSAENDVDDHDQALHASSKALYRTLNPSGNVEMELEELLHNISKARGDAGGTSSSKNKALENAIKRLVKNKSGKALDENDLKIANKRFQSGRLPKLKMTSDTGNSEDADYEIPTSEKTITKIILQHVMSSSMYVWKFAEKAVSRTGRTWMWTLLPTGQISTLLSFLLFSYVIRASFLTWFIPLALFFVSIVVMVVSTIRLIRGKKRFSEFEAWGEFLNLISAQEEKSIDTGKAEETYVINHVTPNVHFLVASLCCVMGFATSDKSWVLTSESATLSLLMYGIVVWVFNFYAVSQTRNILICQVLSSVLRGFHCSDASQVFGMLTSFQIPYLGAQLNISLASLLRMIMAWRLAAIATSSKRNTKFNVHLIRHVLPVVIAIVWWDVANLFCCHCTLSGIARATLECATVLFALPLVIILMSYALFGAMFSIGPVQLFITAVAIIISIAYISLLGKKIEFARKVSAFLEKSSLKRSISILAFLILGYVMLYYRPAGLRVVNSNLSWANYRDLCVNPTTHVAGNGIATEATCYEFRGYDVTWEGVIQAIRVTKIENKVDDLLNLFPQGIAAWLSCKYGNPYPEEENCSNLSNLPPLDVSQCKLSRFSAQACSIQNHNIYTFEVDVNMPLIDGTSGTVTLSVSNEFTNMLLELRKGTLLKFNGFLTGNKGYLSAHTLSITGEDGLIKAENRVHGIARTFDVMIDEASSALYSFLFYPIISLV